MAHLNGIKIHIVYLIKNYKIRKKNNLKNIKKEQENDREV